MSAPEVGRSPDKKTDHNTSGRIGDIEAARGHSLTASTKLKEADSDLQVRQLAETAAAVNNYNSYARSLMLVHK